MRVVVSVCLTPRGARGWGCRAAGRRVERRGGPRRACREPNQWVNELCFACCRTQSAGEICEDIPSERSKLPTLGLLIMIMLIMTTSQCKWAPSRNIISLSNRHIPHSLTKNDPDTATQYMGPKRANFMPFRPPPYSTIVLESRVLFNCIYCIFLGLDKI